MKPFPIELLICDCDGVIVDSEILAERAWRECLSRYVAPEIYEPELAGTFGMTSSAIARRVQQRFGDALPDDFVEQVVRLCEDTIAREVEVIDGVHDALSAIDLPLAVASNGWSHHVEQSLARSGLAERVGNRIFAADMVEHPKPAPDVYLLAAHTVGVAPERCLVVEDSSTGVRAARAAGMHVLGFVGASHIPDGHDQALERLGAVTVVRHMRELPAVVQALRAPVPASQV